MMARRARWVVAGLAAIVAVAILWLLLREPTEPPAAQSPTPRQTTAVAATPGPRPTSAPTARIPTGEAEGMTIKTADEQGRRQWEIHAEVVVVDSARNTAQLSSVRGTYYRKGEPVMRFTSPQGTFHIQSRNVVLTGGVRAVSSSGRTMEAKTVSWSPKTQMLEATGSVVLRQRGLVTYADRVTTDVNFEHTRMQGNVRIDIAE